MTVGPSDVLGIYASALLQISGARTITVFLVPRPGGGGTPRLIHAGESDPVPELRDLTSAIDFADNAERRLDKRADRRTAHAPDAVASVASDGVLLPIPSAATLAIPCHPRSHQPDRRAAAEPETPLGWLGLRMASAADRDAVADDLRKAVLGPVDAQRTSFIPSWLLELGGALASHQLRFLDATQDAVAGLPGRAALQNVLAEEMARARMTRRGFALAFVNPDDFASINDRFGREEGDRVIREIAEVLASTTRQCDFAARFGGVIFAVVVVRSTPRKAVTIGARIRTALSGARYLDGAVTLDFSVGVAAFDADDNDLREPLDLVRRADQALGAAKRSGGGAVREWGAATDAGEAAHFDRLSGVFTGNMSKDYRNTAVLWDVLDAISGDADPGRLADRSLEALFKAVNLERIALLTTDDSGTLQPARMLQRNPGTQPTLRSDFELESGARFLVERARSSGIAQTGQLGRSDGKERHGYAVPLQLGDTTAGCLFLDGWAGELVLEEGDTVFLQALARQLAVALDRARLAEAERHRQDDEHRRLRAELHELRNALQQARFIHRSDEMEEVLATVRRVAPTGVTVLITGESGTGKELLAHTIHDLSPVRDGPFVVVDCGAIPPTLVESELFGHEKGAFTGAGQRTKGRLEEAASGTAFLDEISELPLEVQSRLLRFVQEKELTRVGATRSRRIEVRIIAASNRDLPAEVAAGRFREDLYHRLNVIHVEVPPLRSRRDDILHIARHYLETFALTYQRGVHRFTPAAERRLEIHQWPGNVRELQNRVMQAVILCDSVEIDVADLGFLGQGPGSDDDGADAADLPVDRRSGSASGSNPPDSAAESATESDPGDVWRRLRVALASEVESALNDNATVARPLGKWLAEDLMLAAYATAKTARHSAEIIGVPETTFGRNLRRAQANASAGNMRRSGTWSAIRHELSRLVSNGGRTRDLLDCCERVLVEEIHRRTGGDAASGAALLGVTPPTYRRRLERLTSS